MDLYKVLSRIDKVLGSMKFALWVISIFTLIMIIATFVESLYSVEFAQRLIYKSYPFMILQGLMFLSILIATLNRLPFKKRLTGFYILHLGLLLLFLGSFVSYYAGIDGLLTLEPKTSSSEVRILE